MNKKEEANAINYIEWLSETVFGDQFTVNWDDFNPDMNVWYTMNKDEYKDLSGAIIRGAKSKYKRLMIKARKDGEVSQEEIYSCYLDLFIASVVATKRIKENLPSAEFFFDDNKNIRFDWRFGLYYNGFSIYPMTAALHAILNFDSCDYLYNFSEAVGKVIDDGDAEKMKHFGVVRA